MAGMGVGGMLISLLVTLLIIPSVTRASGSRSFGVTGGVSVFGTVCGGLSLVCISALSTRRIINGNIGTVLKDLSPCAACCPRRGIGRLGGVLANGCTNINTIIHCGFRLRHIYVDRPCTGVPTTRIKLGGNSVVLDVSSRSVAGGRIDCMDSRLHKRPNSSFVLGMGQPDANGVLGMGMAHHAVRVPFLPCCKVVRNNVNCVGFGSFASGYTGSIHHTFVSLGGRKTGKLIFSLEDGNNNSIDRTMDVIGVFLPGKGAILGVGNELRHSGGRCGAAMRPISSIVPVMILIDKGATDSDRVVDNDLRSCSHTVVLNAHACKGNLMRAAVSLPCGKRVGLAATGCCVPDNEYIRTLGCGRTGNNCIRRIPSSLAGIFCATNNERIHSKNNIGPSMRIGPSSLPGVTFCLTNTHSDGRIVLGCRISCVTGRPAVTPTGSFTLASTSCSRFGSHILGTSFGCSHRARGCLGSLRGLTGFRKCCRSTGPRFRTLGGGLDRGITGSLSFGGSCVGRLLRGSVITTCCFRTKTVRGSLHCSGRIGTTIGLLGSPRRCKGVLRPIGGWRRGPTRSPGVTRIVGGGRGGL